MFWTKLIYKPLSVSCFALDIFIGPCLIKYKGKKGRYNLFKNPLSNYEQSYRVKITLLPHICFWSELIPSTIFIFQVLFVYLFALTYD